MKISHTQKVHAINKKIKAKNTLIIGTDISKEKHSYYFSTSQKAIKSNTSKSKFLELENSQKGFKELILQIKQRVLSLDKVVVGMEPTSIYWKPLKEFLVKEGITVVLVDPNAVYYNRKTINGNQSKTDKKDAYAIYDLLKQNKFLIPRKHSARYQEGQTLLTDIHELETDILRKKNQLRAKLGIVFPEFENIFADAFKPSTLRFLQNFSSPKLIVSLSESEFIKKAREVCTTTTIKLKRIYAEARTTTALENHDTEHIVIFTKMLLMLMEEKEKIFEKCYAIAQTDSRFKRLLEIEGIGHKIAIGIYFSLGDYNEIDSSKKVTKLAGLDVIFKQSGTSINGVPRISKCGSMMMRTWGTKAAISLLHHDNKYSVLYARRKKNSNKSGAGKKALIAVADSVLRTCYAILKDDIGYNPKRDEELGRKFRKKTK